MFFILLGFSFFLMFSSKAEAADSDVVINEVMADPSCPSDLCEWVELYNNGGAAVNLNGWTLDGKVINDPLAVIKPQDFLIATKNLTEFQKILPDISIPVIQVAIGLTNSGDSINLQKDSYIDQVSWSSSKVDISWERLDSTKIWAGNNVLSLVLGGTPGEDNSVSQIIPPQKPKVLPINVIAGDEIIFSFEKEENVIYKIIISKNFENSDLLQPFSLEDVDFLESGTFYWQVIATNELYEVKSDIATLQITNPIYSENIVINELYPDPSSGEEWIELYNNSDEVVNLDGWAIEDLSGSTNRFDLGPIDIPARGYLLLLKTQTGITFNNDQDGAKLIRPDGVILSQTPLFTSGQKGWSFARAPDATWIWTTQITPGSENLIVLPPVTSNVSEETEETVKVPVNDEPIEIKTGETEKYRDYLVHILGEVTRTSGNTFYIDDGSGEVKVYIQEKTGIQKPKMYTGDTFEIFGIVNLYRGVFRILPQAQDDIRLIEHPQNASTAKTKKASKVASAATALASSIKTVKAAEDSAASTAKQKAKSSIWIQLLKALLAFSVVLFVVFIIRIKLIKKTRPIGYDFGNDET